MGTFNVDLGLLGPCNYACSYCIGDGPPSPHSVHLHNLARLRELYAMFPDNTSTTLHSRGTEPALHPQMSAIADIVRGPLRILTNLSIPVERWLSRVDGISLQVTIHPEAEKDSTGFLLRVMGAVRYGYDVQVQMLGDDDRPDWRERLEAIGVTRPFKVYKIRTNERWAAQSAEIAPMPAGTLCRAGYDSITIGPTTILYRCPLAQQIIPRHLAQPGPCQWPHADTRCEARWVK